MLRNYFIVATRHLLRHKLFSVVNVLCLAVGITFAMLIGSYVLYEKNVNSTLRNVGQQYLIKSNWSVENMGLPITTAAPLPKALKDEYPSLVQDYFRFNPVTNVVSAGDKHFKQNISICDTNLVSMYGFRLLHGNPASAMPTSTSAVITAKLAKKLFDTDNAVGKTISVTTTAAGSQDYIISAVLDEMAPNSVNNLVDAEGYDVFVPFEGNQFFGGSSYIDSWSYAYVVGLIQLKPGVTPSQLSKPVSDLLSRRLPDNIKGLLTVEFAGLRDLHLQDNNGAVAQMITTLSLVAFFILLMAVINFINISIGTSAYRLKEIGLRKVFGSARKQLVIQYLVEAILLTFIAALVSLAFYEMVQPLFEKILGVPVVHIWQFSNIQVLFLVVLVPLLGLVAGAYPAFVLSSSDIVHAVKGKLDSAKGGMALRKVLLTVQFTLAIFVFIAALNVSRQVEYFFKKDLGYDKEQLLVITAFPKQWDAAGVQRIEAIRSGLARLPSVKDASVSFEVPDRMPPNTTDLMPLGDGVKKPVVVPTIIADANFASTFALSLVNGSFLNGRVIDTATSEIVLNETAARLLKADAGQNVLMPDGFTFIVRGVVKDFNLSSFQQQIGPVAFIPTTLANSYRYITLKLRPGQIDRTLAEIRAGWKDLSPNAPFEYTFMDDRFESLYQSEIKLKRAADLATGLNLFIVFMGIFGIVAFTLAKRTREIAVRKVLGAKVKDIIALFIRDYTLLLIIANIIAWPFAYIVTNRWLQDYAYRMKQDLVPYVTVALSVSLITVVFITLQCLKAGISNPVKNLRAD